jgi:hypothetical protein
MTVDEDAEYQARSVTEQDLVSILRAAELRAEKPKRRGVHKWAFEYRNRKDETPSA